MTTDPGAARPTPVDYHANLPKVGMVVPLSATLLLPGTWNSPLNYHAIAPPPPQRQNQNADLIDLEGLTNRGQDS